MAEALAGRHPHDVVYVIDYRDGIPARHELRVAQEPPERGFWIPPGSAR